MGQEQRMSKTSKRRQQISQTEYSKKHEAAFRYDKGLFLFKKDAVINTFIGEILKATKKARKLQKNEN